MDDMARYAGREATWVKHQVLRQYLEKLAYKVGWWNDALNYVDGFAGPWRSEAEDLSDTSPHIAVKELRTARAGLLAANRPAPRLRCLFIEKNPEACQRLRDSVEPITDVQTYVFQGEFEEHISDVLGFASIPAKAFTFFFIDPTGWTGFGMNAIAPVLRHPRGEVLINFMTKDIKRFIDDPQSLALPTFVDLFGSKEYRSEWQGLVGQEREDAIVEAYCSRVKAVGGFKHVVSAIVLHPTDERTHFHLIYATREDEGLRTFRGVEARTMAAQVKVRAAAQQTDRVKRSGQAELFSAEEIGTKGYFERLRENYLTKSRRELRSGLEQQGMASFDQLELAGLSMPMTWPADVQSIMQDWKMSGLVRFEGLRPRERTLKHGSGHVVVWTSGTGGDNG